MIIRILSRGARAPRPRARVAPRTAREENVLTMEQRASRWPASRRFAAAILFFFLGTMPVAPRADSSQPADPRSFLCPVSRLEQAAAPAGDGSAERVVPDAALSRALLSLSRNETAILRDWPAGPGVRRDMEMSRMDVYAANSRVVVIDRNGTREVPRSSRVFFTGEALGDPSVRLMLAVDPLEGIVLGFSQTPQGFHELRPEGPARPERTYLLANSEAFRRAEAPDATWNCGQEMLPFSEKPRTPPRKGTSLPAAPRAATKSAIIAVDTDNEFMQLKFSDNTTNATSYIASLFAAMNVIYERDTGVRLLIGETTLRVSGSPDPWTVTGSPASGAQLTEFSNWWAANKVGTTRALATLLSGKSSSPNSASGIAWLDALCDKSFGYSFCQVFRIDYLSGDTLIVAHEIGHNFASPHTHCYEDPKPDTCVNFESCYTGPTACPPAATYQGVPNVTGTLMSYCHLSGISGCTTSLVFHPASLTRYLDGAITAATGSCIFPLTAPTPNFTFSPASPLAGQLVTFTDTSTGSPTSWSWTFGDGGTSTAQNPSHTYASAGTFTVRLTATNASGGNWVEKPVTVTAAGAPVADFTWLPVNPAAGAPASFIDTSTGSPTSWAWTFGDGGTSTAQNPSHAFAAPGVYQVTLQATNPSGSNSKTKPLTVPGPAGFNTLSPCRVLDTRNATGSDAAAPILEPFSTRVFAVANRCGIPASAKAISVNLAVVNAQVRGNIVVYPSDEIAPVASMINFPPSAARTNNAIVRVAPNASIAVRNNAAGTVDFILDVNGWFE